MGAAALAPVALGAVQGASGGSGFSGMGGGGSGPQNAGPATNRSVSINGASGVTESALGQLLQFASGSEANGGYTPNTFAGSIGLGRAGSMMPLLLIGGGVLAVVVLLVMKR